MPETGDGIHVDVREIPPLSRSLLPRSEFALLKGNFMLTNKMKSKLLSNTPAFGVSIMIPSPQLVEMVAKLGFDWVLIDCEHGTINLETVETLAMAAQVNGITPIARPRTKDPADIQQVMDRGVMGVQVPHVNTAADARAVVEAVKYHPIGKRGLAAGTRPANYGYGITQSEYVEEANRETLICVQFEDKEAIDNADEILKVDDIDVFFIGPSDLSQSMGFPGQVDEPSVAHAIDSTFNKILKADQISGTPGNADKIRSVLDRGVLYTYTHATKLLGSGAEAFFSATGT